MIIKFIISILIPQIAGGIGSLFTAPSINSWYSHLSKPSFNPPGWIFAPVWTGLFLLMGIALFIIWKNGLTSNISRMAVAVFAVQLILNVLWSIIFFGLHSPMVAFGEIIVLWISILINMILFWQINTWAGVLLLPYLLWVSFASVLNFMLWRLN